MRNRFRPTFSRIFNRRRRVPSKSSADRLAFTGARVVLVAETIFFCAEIIMARAEIALGGSSSPATERGDVCCWEFFS